MADDKRAERIEDAIERLYRMKHRPQDGSVEHLIAIFERKLDEVTEASMNQLGFFTV